VQLQKGNLLIAIGCLHNELKTQLQIEVLRTLDIVCRDTYMLQSRAKITYLHISLIS
jgi:hypothetical protein